MAKILISWIAHNNDFLIMENFPVQVNTGEGPTYQYHEHFWENYDRHVILYTEKDDQRAGLLRTKLQRDFKDHQVEMVSLQIHDPIDLTDIHQKVQAQLENFREDAVDIFFSPGTSIMQVSWFICHITMGMDTRLVQTRSGRHTKDGNPQRSFIETEMSSIPVSAILKMKSDNALSGDRVGDIYLTDTIKKVYDRAYKVAQTDRVSCIIIGESGTGKENLAQYIHNNSPRKDEKYLALNCSALSDHLLETRLFGYKKGSFTGAEKDTPGIFDSLDKGTLFMDEIGDISPYMQQSLLRVLQEGTFTPVGGTEEKKVDVRIISATNKDLRKACENGKFRWDLYYRITTVDLHLPSLAECGPDEVDEFFLYFLDVKQKSLMKEHRLKPSREVVEAVKNYPFPGNIRELENLTEKLYVFCDKTVEIWDLPEEIRHPDESVSLLMDDVEKRHIERVLELKNYNKSSTAEAIGWAYNTLVNKMKKYQIEDRVS